MLNNEDPDVVALLDPDGNVVVNTDGTGGSATVMMTETPPMTVMEMGTTRTTPTTVRSGKSFT